MAYDALYGVGGEAYYLELGATIAVVQGLALGFRIGTSRPQCMVLYVLGVEHHVCFGFSFAGLQGCLWVQAGLA